MTKAQQDAARKALVTDKAAARKHEGLWGRLSGTDAVAPRDITKPFGATVREVELDSIKPDPGQPRKTLDQTTLKELAATLKDVGVLQPITVTWSEELNCYVVLTGERRYEAAKLAGLKTIPAIIKVGTGETRRRKEQLIENNQRENLPALEEAAALAELIEQNKWSQRTGAKELGKPLTYVAELLAIHKIPTNLKPRVKTWPKSAQLQLARIQDPKDQLRAVERGLDSKTPYTEVKKHRHESKEQLVRFRQTYELEGSPLKAIITGDIAPDDVAEEDVAEFLSKLARKLSAPPRRRR